MRRRIINASVKAIALCRAGKNQMSVLYKGNGSDSAQFAPLLKAADNFDEKGEILGVVYSPDRDDLDGDSASPEVIRKMAHSFAREGFQLDIEHDGEVLDKSQAFVAESFVIQKGDPRFAGWKDKKGNLVDTEGAWGILLRVEDESLRKAYREGEWDGLSLAGPATVKVIEKSESNSDDVVDRVLERLRAQLRTSDSNQGDIEMKPDELKDLFKSTIVPDMAKTIATAVAEAIKPAEEGKETEKKVEQKKSEDAIEFEGDRSNPDDVRAHAEKLKAKRLEKSVDWNDPKAVENYLATLEKSKGTKKTEASESDEVKAVRAELDAVQEKLRKAMGASKQGTEQQDTDSKDDKVDYVKLGKSIANYANGKK